MSAPHGAVAQFGYAVESTPGEAETVDTFLPLLSENLAQEIERLESQSQMAGQLASGQIWQPGQRTLTGPVELELWNLDTAALWLHIMGAVSADGTSPAIEKTYTPGTLTGKALTVQVGMPDIGGTVRPKTWSGCKVASWQVSSDVGQLAQITLNLIGMSETTATSLASPSYDAGLRPFSFVEGAVSIAEDPVAVIRQIQVGGENQIPVRHRQGSADSREPLENGPRNYTGQFTADFVDLDAYNRFVNGTEAEVKITFDNGTEKLEIISSRTRFDGTTPRVAGRDILEQQLPFKALPAANGNGAALQVVLTSDEPDPTPA